MSSNPDNMILGLPRRPLIADASAASIVAAIASGLLKGNLFSVGISGNPSVNLARNLSFNLEGSALANQPQPLEMAIREHLAKHGLEVVFFYRSPRSVKVTFRYRPTAFWTIETVMPDDLNLAPNDTEDWLYGSLITNALPDALQQIQPLTA